MAGTSRSTGEAGQPTHYEVLGLSRDVLDDQKDAAALVRRAYRRALLRHHPDKAVTRAQTHGQPRHQAAGSDRDHMAAAFSVDRIAEAFGVLSDRKRRADYDASLRVGRGPATGAGPGHEDFQTGLETVDLDDLEFD